MGLCTLQPVLCTPCHPPLPIYSVAAQGAMYSIPPPRNAGLRFAVFIESFGGLNTGLNWNCIKLAERYQTTSQGQSTLFISFNLLNGPVRTGQSTRACKVRQICQTKMYIVYLHFEICQYYNLLQIASYIGQGTSMRQVHFHFSSF